MTNRCLTCGTQDWCEHNDGDRQRHGRVDQPDKTRQHLAEIPGLLALVAGFRQPGSAPADPDGQQPAKPANPSRPPVRLDVVDLLDNRPKDWADDPAGSLSDWLSQPYEGRRLGVEEHIGAWAMLVHTEMIDAGQPVTRPDDETVTADCGFLASHLAWIVEQHPDFARDVKRVHDDLQRSTGVMHRKQRLVCMSCGWDVDERDEGSWFSCRGCGKNWTRIEAHRMAAKKKPRTINECATELGVSIRKLRMRIAEGLIRPVARDGSADLFDMQQVMEATIDLRYRNSRPAKAG